MGAVVSRVNYFANGNFRDVHWETNWILLYLENGRRKGLGFIFFLLLPVDNVL